jgi:hypothetical protein
MRTKIFSTVFLTVLLTVILVPDLSAGNSPKKSLSYKQAEMNYLQGILSDNEGLTVSATYFLGEMKSDEAVIPLMNQLKSSEDESCRIAAALALTKIGDERGIYSVKKAAQFDESKRVRDLCWKFYMTTILKGTNRF